MSYENKFVDGRSLKQALQGILTKFRGEKVTSANTADKLAQPRNITINGAVSGTTTFDGSGDVTIVSTLNNLDASKIMSGTISIDRLPQGALERLVIVENDEARFQLTADRVQNGDTVKVNDTQKMYFVKDQSQLSIEAGYEVYSTGKATAVDWSGVQGKPEAFPPEAHNQASDTINAMTGYTKTGSGAIGTGDTLNQAIGKLEVGLDGKFDKSGGDVDGTINSKARVNLKSTVDDRERYQIGFDASQNRLFIYDSINSVSVLDYTTNNKNLTLNAQNLQTSSKEVIGAINEVRTKANGVDDKLDKGGYVGNAHSLKSEIDGKVSKTGDTITGNLEINGNLSVNQLNTNDTRLITRNKNITDALNKDLYKRIGNFTNNDTIDYIKIKLSTKYNSPNMQSFKIIGRGLFNTVYTLISEINIGWYYYNSAIYAPKAIISTGEDRVTNDINKEIKIFLANDGGNTAIIIKGGYYTSIDIFRNSDEGMAVESNPIALEIVSITESQKNQLSELVEVKSIVNYNSETLKINKEWETIYTGNVANGTFTTSKSIWDYKYIQIVGSDDEQNKLWIEEHEISNIRYCLENWESKWFLISNGGNFWTVSASTLLADGRTFKTHYENCRIYQIRVSK